MRGFMDKKGQVSMEFIVSVLAVLLVFIFCFGIFEERSNINNTSINSWSAESVVFAFSKNINNVSLMDNNSSLCDYIYWDEPNQSLHFGGGAVSAVSDDVYVGSPVVANNVVWSVADINGRICFSKRNGLVYVEYE